jgi:hypothetical protein
VKIDIAKLNSLTKYPSIPTWHELDGKGVLTNEVATKIDPNETLYLTEKCDGANGRIVCLGNMWWIGSRDSLLLSNDGTIRCGDNPLEFSIVWVLKPIADAMQRTPCVHVWFFEVFGWNIGAAAREYTVRDPRSMGGVDKRLFDRAVIGNSEQMLADWSREKIASWRQHGGQKFDDIETLASPDVMPLDRCARVAALGTIGAGELPKTIADGRPFIERWVGQRTRYMLSPEALGRTEGIVARTKDRSVIVKLRLEDYDRAMRKTQRSTP